MEKLSVKHLSCSCGGAIKIHPVSMNHDDAVWFPWWDPPVNTHWNFGSCETILQIGEGVFFPTHCKISSNQHVVLRKLRKAEFSKYFQNIHDIATVWTPQSKGASTLFLSRRQSHRKSRTRFPWWKVHDADRIDMDRFQHDFKSWHNFSAKTEPWWPREVFSNLWFLGLNWTNHTNKWYHYISHGAQDLTRIFRRLSFKISLYNDMFCWNKCTQPD